MTTLETKEPAWAEAEIAQLRTLCDVGLSASQIAARLGTGKSRNAIIGKMHRLGLTKSAPAAPVTEPRERPPKPRPIRRTPSLPALRPVAQVRPQPVVIPAPVPVVIDGARITVATLESGMCRWPIGDPGDDDFHFCAAPQQDGKPYCSHHCDRAYNASSKANHNLIRATTPGRVMRAMR